jgi:hypothetical protein
VRRIRCKKQLTGDKHVADRLVYSIFFDTWARDRSANGVDGPFATLNDNKRLEVILVESWRNGQWVVLGVEKVACEGVQSLRWERR